MNEQASDQASDAQNSPANGMEMYDRNVDAIAAFIESGCIADEGALGIELEHIIVREDGSPVNYSGEDGIQSVLEVLRADYPQATYDAEGDLLGVCLLYTSKTTLSLCSLIFVSFPSSKLF